MSEEWACPECHSTDTQELFYNDDFGSRECNQCGYKGTPGEEFCALEDDETPCPIYDGLPERVWTAPKEFMDEFDKREFLDYMSYLDYADYIRGDIHTKVKTEHISIIDEMHQEIVALQKASRDFATTTKKCIRFFASLQFAKAFNLDDSNELMEECKSNLESGQSDV